MSNPSSPTPARLLVIDDCTTLRSVLRTLLGSRGYSITEAESGEAGIAQASIRRPDLILLDVMMPGLDGFETCRRLKAIPQLVDVPVIFLTALGRADQMVAGFLAGGVDYVTKPFTNEVLVARVETHLRVARRLHTLVELVDGRGGMDRDEMEDADRGKREQLLVTQVTAFLVESLREPPGLAALARLFASNEHKLTLLFRRHLNTTVFGFIREQRLRRAARLLRETDLPIQIIADQAGYRSNSDLTVSFKGRFGVPPREYRKQLRQRATPDD